VLHYSKFPLKKWLPVRPGEAGAVLLSAACFFLLLMGYYSERTLPSVQIGMLRLRLPFRSPPFVDALKPLPVLGFAPLADFRHPRRAARSIIGAV